MSRENKLRTVLIKPCSADCNLQCTYCFYRRPIDPYRHLPHHRMDYETLSNFIRQYQEMGSMGLGYSWQGGEPMLMGLDFFKKVISLQIEHAKAGMGIGNAIQTNAVLIDEEWAKFFHKYNFLIGVSIDGPEEIHDHYRGKGTFQKVMRSIQVLKSYGVEYNILTVVNDLTSQKVDTLVNFFLSNDIYYLQFIPCVERDYSTGEITPFSVNAKQYEHFMCRLFDIWYNNGQPYFSVRIFDNTLMAYMGHKPELCWFRESCGEYIVMEYNGDIYPCDFFVQKRWKMGNLKEIPLKQIMEGEVIKKFDDLKTADYEECKKCEWKFICCNGCPRFRVINEKEGVRENYLCEAYTAFFKYSHKRFEKLATRLKSEGKGSPLRQ